MRVIYRTRRIDLMKNLLFVAIFFAVCGMLGLSSCSSNGRKSSQDSLFIDTLTSDSTAEDSAERIITDTPMPKAADELFDDFIFNFAANKKLQFSRITFPLAVINGKKTKTLSKKEWKMEHFFMRQDYYTLIFDNAAQAEAAKDTNINHVILEKIYLDRKIVKQYIFNRKQGVWMMDSVNTTNFSKSPNASFLHFYSKFASDEEFQIESVNDPLHFLGPDPDNDFDTMDGILMPEQWPSFAPPLPQKMIYNIIYQKQGRGSNQKIFIIRGIANGIETELTFKRKSGEWKVTELHM